MLGKYSYRCRLQAERDLRQAHFSGGSDSDDMVDVVEHLKPGSGCEVDYVWFNTGIEMDATKAHIRYLKGRYGIEIHEESGKKKVAAAVRSVGYPFYSKQFSEYIERLQKHNFKWEDKPFDVLYAEYPQCKAALRWWCNNWKAEPHRPLQTEIASATYLKEFMVRNPPTFSISKKCCDLAKKSAGDLARKKYAAGIQFIGGQKGRRGGHAPQITRAACQTDGTDCSIFHCFGGKVRTKRCSRNATESATVKPIRCTGAGGPDVLAARLPGVSRTNCSC